MRTINSRLCAKIHFEAYLQNLYMRKSNVHMIQGSGNLNEYSSLRLILTCDWLVSG